MHSKTRGAIGARSLVAIACLAANFASPVLAQQTPAEPAPEAPPPVPPTAAPPPAPEPVPQPMEESPVELTPEPPPAREAPPPREAEAMAEVEGQGEEAPDAKQKISGKAGWGSGGGFYIASDDESYKLRIGLQSGYKAELIHRDGEFQDRSPFFTVRPILAGNIFRPWIQFWTSLEVARNPPYLLDAYVDIIPIDEIGLRLGQQYTPFSRHEYYGPQQLLFPEFAPVAEYFWSGRDKGLTALGVLGGGLIEYWAGFYGGSPLRQFTTFAGNYVIEGRVTINPMGPVGATEYPYIVGKGEAPAPFGISFNLNGYYGKVQTAEENFNPTTFLFVVTPSGVTTRNGTLGADVFIQASRFVFFVEAYYRNTDPEDGEGDYDSVGVWGQAGYMLVTNMLDVAVRVNWLDPSTDLESDQFTSIEGQFGYYISAPNLVLKLRYGFGDQETPDMDELGPVRLPFVVGETHLMTLQLNLAF